MLTEEIKKLLYDTLVEVAMSKQFFFISDILDITGETKRYGITSNERKYLNSIIGKMLKKRILGVSEVKNSTKQYYVININVSIKDYL